MCQKKKKHCDYLREKHWLSRIEYDESFEIVWSFMGKSFFKIKYTLPYNFSQPNGTLKFISTLWQKIRIFSLVY